MLKGFFNIEKQTWIELLVIIPESWSTMSASYFLIEFMNSRCFFSSSNPATF